jgi:hypothetical protein
MPDGYAGHAHETVPVDADLLFGEAVGKEEIHQGDGGVDPRVGDRAVVNGDEATSAPGMVRKAQGVGFD